MTGFHWWAIYSIYLGVWLAAVYWFILRCWLARQPALRGVYVYLDEMEAGSFAKFRVSMSGLKRQLFSRAVWLAGVLVAIHDFALPLLGLIDIQPFIPAEYRQYYPFAMAVLGAIFEWLSKISPQPVGQVNPGVIASASDTPFDEVAIVTAPDPVVAVLPPDPPIVPSDLPPIVPPSPPPKTVDE